MPLVDLWTIILFLFQILWIFSSTLIYRFYTAALQHNKILADDNEQFSLHNFCMILVVVVEWKERLGGSDSCFSLFNL